MARTYTLKQRAVRRDEVRRRIIDAAAVLKQTKNPNDISMADVAEQAGVGRVTVYRHFRDLGARKGAFGPPLLLPASAARPGALGRHRRSPRAAPRRPGRNP